MILISSDRYDYSTNYVIDWLDYSKEKFTRINKDDLYQITFNDSQLCINFNGENIDLSTTTGYFYRRGKIHFQQDDNSSFNTLNDISSEHDKIINEYINYILESKVSIGKYSDVSINKLIVLEIAKNIGFKVPVSYLLEKKSDLTSLLNQYPELITKNHSNTSFFECEDGVLIAYTQPLDENNYKQIPESFSPSLFQEKIDKKYEIRVFYLKGKIWSMAIFSQSNTLTEDDYRKVTNNTIRNVPYLLPSDIEHKIQTLMKRINLDTGSIDLIVNKDKEYIFLEVNPIGQFGSVSYNCNYNIEKEIAKILADEH